tara:strand:+ start:233 stop:457 length:225 start_codon:yes stop_codon:yes gene_type:complete
MLYIDFNRIKDYQDQLLKLSYQEKIEVLKLAYREGIDVWFETSSIIDLPSETIEQLFEILILKSNDIFGDEIKK